MNVKLIEETESKSLSIAKKKLLALSLVNDELKFEKLMENLH